VLRRILILLGALGLLGAASTASAQPPSTTAPPTTLPASPTTVAPVTTTVSTEGQAAPPSVLVVDPDSGLLDGQVVQLSGTGWGPVVPAVYLCGGVVGDTSVNCVVVGQVEPGPGDTLSGSATLPATFTTPGGRAVDCRAEQCVVFVTNYRGNGDTAAVTFATVIAASPGFTG